MSTPRRRFHDGCWTCKSKRFQCDRARPHCLTCRQRGFDCEGYGLRLRWGAGVASRGRFAGASQPVAAAILPRPKGRRRDLDRKKRLQETTMELCGARTPRCAEPFQAAVIVSELEEETETPVSIASGDELPSIGWHRIRIQDQVPGHDNLGKTAPARRPEHVATWMSQRTMEEELLFNEFLSSGINTLHSTTASDAGDLLGKHLPMLCEQSEALHTVCLALQASLCSQPSIQEKFFAYFDRTLSVFRTELGNSAHQLGDGTFAAGLLLCTIGLSHGLPWTMHLHGMYNILSAQALNKPFKSHQPFRRHLLEVMGYMDLPSFAVGRQNPSIGVWKRHCLDENHALRPPLLDSVEIVSGLPRSLIDILATVDNHDATEEAFWLWPGAPGTLLQSHLWEAYRLAGILTIRHAQLHVRRPGPRPGPDFQLPSADSRCTCSKHQDQAPLTSTEVIVTRIAGHLDAVTRASLAPEAATDSLIFNALDYPLFMAGLQVDVLNDKAYLKNAIRDCFVIRKGGPYPNRRSHLLELLEEWWTCPSGTASIHDLAIRRGLEIGLL